MSARRKSQAWRLKACKQEKRKLTMRLLLVSALTLHSQFGRHLDVVFKQDALVECVEWVLNKFKIEPWGFWCVDWYFFGLGSNCVKGPSHKSQPHFNSTPPRVWLDGSTYALKVPQLALVGTCTIYLHTSPLANQEWSFTSIQANSPRVPPGVHSILPSRNDTRVGLSDDTP